MKTKILIAVLSIGLFSASTAKAQETKQVQIKHEQIGVTYTCPMHADVKSDKPGTCPKCGMELKKMDMSMDSTKMDMKHDSMMMNHSKMEKKMYTCPMHSDVKSDKPGDCPKCGMELKEMKMDSTKMEMKHGAMKMDHSKKEMKLESTKTGDVSYACPMQCEGKKTYKKPGSCPKCNMDLKKQK